MEALAMQLMNVASDMVGSGELISAATIPKISVEGGADVFGRLLKGCASMEEVATEGDSPPPVDTRQAVTGQHDQELVMQQEVVAGMMAAAVLQVPMAETRPMSPVTSASEGVEAQTQAPILAVQQDQSPGRGNLVQVQTEVDMSHDRVVPETAEMDMQRQAAAYGSALSMAAESSQRNDVEYGRNEVEQVVKQPLQGAMDRVSVDTPQQIVRAVASSVLVEPQILTISGTDNIVSRDIANHETVVPETTAKPVVSVDQRVVAGGKNDTLMVESISEVSVPPISAEAPVQVEITRKTTGLPEEQQRQAVAIEAQESPSVDEVALRAEIQQEENVADDLPVFTRQGAPTALASEQQYQNKRVAVSPAEVSPVTEHTAFSPAGEVTAVSSPSLEGGGTDDQPLHKPLSEVVIVAEDGTVPSGMVSQTGETPRFSTTVSHHESQSTLEELPGKIMQEVHQHFSNQRTLASGQDQITIRLTPEHLGEVKLTIAMEGQQLSVEIMSDNPQARETIMQYADSLKESLSRQNINLDSFEVTSQDRGSGGFSRGRDEWRQFSASQNNLWISRAGYAAPEVVTGQLPPAYGGITNNSMIDLHF